LNDLTHVDLFSGIGGFALAAGWAGFKTVAFCEIEKFCQEVLKKHWPDVPIHDDIRTFKWTGERPTLITGGFPCQDISRAGSGIGIEGQRSGLWSEYFRIVCEIRPKYVLVENVSALLGRGLERVLGNLASVGYDAEWHCISAAYVGRPHLRDRLWVLAYPHGLSSTFWILNRNGHQSQARDTQEEEWGDYRFVPQVGRKIHRRLPTEQEWVPKPEILRMVDGLPGELDRIKALGNSIVPAVAFQIIKGIADIERQVA
jgi:DNA (cytosine-5)-methyltransferase 1